MTRRVWSDKACEILGLGCVTKEKAAVGLGTTATITFMMDRYLEPERFIPPYPAIIRECYNPEIEIFVDTGWCHGLRKSLWQKR